MSFHFTPPTNANVDRQYTAILTAVKIGNIFHRCVKVM